MVNTTKLNGHGQYRTVLAKADGNAYQAVNMKQAQNKLRQLQGEGYDNAYIVDRGRCKYISFK